MANIQERRNRDGKLISFSIRVHRGRDAKGKQLKPYTATFDVKDSWSEKQQEKKPLILQRLLKKLVKRAQLQTRA